ncbi:hypothetical protein CsatA_022514 [Cannabis sativa]
MVIQVHFATKTVVVQRQKVQTQCSKEQLMSKFKRHDMNGDGKLSKNDIKKVFKELGSSSGFYRANIAMFRSHNEHNGYVNINDDKEFEELVDYAYECGYKVEACTN